MGRSMWRVLSLLYCCNVGTCACMSTDEQAGRETNRPGCQFAGTTYVALGGPCRQA